jgi:hypothetical protein
MLCFLENNTQITEQHTSSITTQIWLKILCYSTFTATTTTTP